MLFTMDLAAANTRPGSAARLSERGTASSSAPAAGPSTDSSKGAEQSGDGTIWRTRVEGAFTIEEEIRPSLSWVDIFSPTKRVEALREEVNLIRGTAPYAARLLGETLTIAPARTIVVVGGNFLKGFIPSLGLKATGELIRAASDAAEKKILDRRRLLLAASGSVGAVLLTHALDAVIQQNDAIIDRRLGAKLEYEAMRVHLRLDIPSHEDPEVQELLKQASRIVGFRPFDVITRIVRAAASYVDLFSQIAVIRSLLGKSTRLLVFLCTLRPLVELFWFRRNINHRVRLTDPNAIRMQEMSQIAQAPHLRKEVALFGLRRWLLAEFARSDAELGDIPIRAVSTDRGRRRNMEVTGKALNALIYVVFAIRAKQSPLLSLATLTLVQQTTSTILSRINGTLAETRTVSKSFRDVQALYDSMTLKPKIVVEEPARRYGDMNKSTEKRPARKGMKIEFRDVTFTYPQAKKPALQGASFTIEAGETCALVGLNGAGKTTIVMLMARMYDPDSGEIFIDDLPLKTYEPEELRMHMSVLPQEFSKFPLSVGENVALGSPRVASGSFMSSVSPSEINEALDAGGATGFTSEMRNGLDTLLIMKGVRARAQNMAARAMASGGTGFRRTSGPGELMDVQLSGGQWQRLGIARAFMRKDAAIHVLDEPTSALDPKAEHDLFVRLSALGSSSSSSSSSSSASSSSSTQKETSSTKIFTTHRFSTTRQADRILVVSEGSIVENGTHAQLVRIEGGRYRELYSLQASGFRDD